jgi:hypothetical protein
MKKQNRITKYIFVLLLLGCLSVLVGCFPTRLIISDEFTSPICVFEYNGSIDDVFSKIKKELAFYDFLEFPNDDRNSAMLVTEIRKLHKDEYYDVNLFFTTPPSFIHSSKEAGRLIFIFNEANHSTKIELFAKIFIELDVDVTTKRSASLPSHHPLLYKFYNIISEIPNIKVVQAPPEQKVIQEPPETTKSSSKPIVEPSDRPSSYTPIIVVFGISVALISVILVKTHNK